MQSYYPFFRLKIILYLKILLYYERFIFMTIGIYHLNLKEF